MLDALTKTLQIRKLQGSAKITNFPRNAARKPIVTPCPTVKKKLRSLFFLSRISNFRLNSHVQEKLQPIHRACPRLSTARSGGCTAGLCLGGEERYQPCPSIPSPVTGTDRHPNSLPRPRPTHCNPSRRVRSPGIDQLPICSDPRRPRQHNH